MTDREFKKHVTFAELDDCYVSKWDGNSGSIRISKSKDPDRVIKYLEDLTVDLPKHHTTHQQFNEKYGVTHNHVYRFHVEECLKRFKEHLLLNNPMADVAMLKRIIKTMEPSTLVGIYKKIKGE